MRKLILAAALAFSASPALAAHHLGGEIVGFAVVPHPAENFPTTSPAWTPTNAEMTFTKRYDTSAIKCDTMVDAWTSSAGRVSVGLWVDGGIEDQEESLSGAGGFVTFAFTQAVYLPKGPHDYTVYASVGDGSLMTVDTTEVGIQCYEMFLFPSSEQP